MRGETMKHAPRRRSRMTKGRAVLQTPIPPREGRVARPKAEPGGAIRFREESASGSFVVVDTPPPRFQRARLP
jgi:hypothetical protein